MITAEVKREQITHSTSQACETRTSFFFFSFQKNSSLPLFIELFLLWVSADYVAAPPPYPAQERARSVAISRLENWSENLLSDTKVRAASELAASKRSNTNFKPRLPYGIESPGDLHFRQPTIRCTSH